MKKHLLSIKENLKAELFTLSVLIRFSENLEEVSALKIKLADLYLLSQEVKDVINYLDLYNTPQNSDHWLS